MLIFILFGLEYGWVKRVFQGGLFISIFYHLNAY